MPSSSPYRLSSRTNTCANFAFMRMDFQTIRALSCEFVSREISSSSAPKPYPLEKTTRLLLTTTGEEQTTLPLPQGLSQSLLPVTASCAVIARELNASTWDTPASVAREGEA